MSDFKFSNKQIADGFECTQGNIREHKSKHKDNFVKNIDYVSDVTLNYKTFWSESGVIKLADYINTKQAKKFIGTLEVKKEILEKQQTKEIIPATSPQPNQIDFLQGLLDVIKSQDTRLTNLESKIDEVAKRPTQLLLEVKTIKDFKGYTKEMMLQKYRRPLNNLVQIKFKDIDPSSRWNFARKVYKQEVGWDFPNVECANESQFQHFFKWLENK